MSLYKGIQPNTTQSLYSLSPHAILPLVPDVRLSCSITSQYFDPPISKSCNSRRELSKLVSNHVFRDRHLKIILSIVNLKLQADKVG